MADIKVNEVDNLLEDIPRVRWSEEQEEKQEKEEYTG